MDKLEHLEDQLVKYAHYNKLPEIDVLSLRDEILLQTQNIDITQYRIDKIWEETKWMN